MSVHPHPSRPGWFRIKLYSGKKDGVSAFNVIPFEGTKDEAEAYERQLKGEVSRLDPGFPDLLPEFLVHYHNRTKPGTHEMMKYAMLHLKAFFGGQKVKNIQPILIEKYKQWRLGESDSKRYINIQLTCLSSYFTYLKGQGVACCKIEKFPKVKPPMPSILTPDEILTIIGHLPEKYKAPYLLMSMTAMRKSEVFNLRGNQVDTSNWVIHLGDSKTGSRYIPVSNDALRAMIEERIQLYGTGYLFTSRNTWEPIQDSRNALQKAIDAAGIQKHVTPHTFRHSAATALCGADINLRIIQTLLGHASVQTTQRYVHISQAMSAKGTDMLATLLGGSTRSTLKTTKKTNKNNTL